MGLLKAIESVKQTLLYRRTVADQQIKALAGSARALAKSGDGMLRVQSPEGRNALHHHVPLPWLWESCKTSAQRSRLQTSDDGRK